MVRFQIHEAYLRGFEILGALDNEVITRLTQFLESVPVGTGPQTFGRLYEDAFQLKAPYERELAMTLYSIGSFNLGLSQKLSADDLASSISSSYLSQINAKLSKEEIIGFREKVLTIIQHNKNLTQTFKAFSLLAENESIIKDNHIVTDIRLLFQDELKDVNRQGLLIHQLKIVAEEDGDQIEYFYNLTASELNKLQEQITRALEKEKLIRSDYKNISFIEITE